VQTDAPDPNVDFPATHGAHIIDETLFAYQPAWQLMHVDDEFAPLSVEYLPCGQEVQSYAPFWSEYLPASQYVQSVPFAILVPMGH
jgi:hypothetical protein